MNKAILVLAIFAICLSPALASNEDRELVMRPVKNYTNTTNTTSPSNTTNTTTPVVNATQPANNTNTTVPVVNTTQPSTNTTAPVVNATQPSNTTNATTPVVNTTQPIVNPDDSDAEPEPTNTTTPVVNTTQPANNTNTTVPVVNATQPSNTTNTTTPVVTPAPAPVKYARNDVNMATFKDDCIRIHNDQRRYVGLNDLTWSDSLAASAQAWAENMAKNGFRHSGKTGENIASTSYSTWTLYRLFGLWTKEITSFIVGCKYPKCSNSTAEVGHYTQMVWHSTTQVGCGFAPGYNRGYNYLCCQYYKAGNIVGQYVY